LKVKVVKPTRTNVSKSKSWKPVAKRVLNQPNKSWCNGQIALLE
jgi:hypothetical protein